MCKPLWQSEKRDGKVHRVEPSLPRVLLARRCCISSPPSWWPRELFLLPRRIWAFSWIFHDGASQPRFSPRSFPADTRTPASSQWHEPHQAGDRPDFAFIRDLQCNAKTNVVECVYVCFPLHTWKGYDSFKKKPTSRWQNCEIASFCRSREIFFEFWTLLLKKINFWFSKSFLSKSIGREEISCVWKCLKMSFLKKYRLIIYNIIYTDI